LPHSMEEALKINEETGTDYWWHVIDKEMSKVKVAWKIATWGSYSIGGGTKDWWRNWHWLLVTCD
jgi:hypothetical protein